MEWKATAIGKNFVNAKTFLEKRYNEEMELEDAIHVALLTLKESFEGEMNEENIEIGIIGDQTNRRFKQPTPAEIKDYLDEALDATSSTVTNRAYWNDFINATTKSRCSIDSICNNKKKHERAIDYLCSSQYSLMFKIHRIIFGVYILFDTRETSICLLRNI